MRNEISRLQAYAKFTEKDWEEYEAMEKKLDSLKMDKSNFETKFYFNEDTNAVEVVYFNDGVIIATLILKKEIGRPKVSKNPIAKSVMITLDESDWNTIDELKVQMGIKSNSEFWRMLLEYYLCNKLNEDGKKMEMINVVNDWTWVRNHAEKMMEDEELENDVLTIARENRIEVTNIIELYHQGLSAGEESGKYLSFKNWFYEFFQL